MGWPGAAYDIQARQKDYTRILTSAAEKFDVQLDVNPDLPRRMNRLSTLVSNSSRNAPRTDSWSSV